MQLVLWNQFVFLNICIRCKIITLWYTHNGNFFLLPNSAVPLDPGDKSQVSCGTATVCVVVCLHRCIRNRLVRLLHRCIPT